MGHGGFARNFESLLRVLDARGHEVVVTLDRPQATGPGDDPAPLAALAAELTGVSLAHAPERAREDWTQTGRFVRAALDYARFLEPAYAPAAKPRERAAAIVPRPVRAAVRAPLVRRALRAADRAMPVEPDLRASVAGFDVVCVTPLVELGSPQLAWVRAAREQGIPSVVCVASWDNLTMRGGIHEAPDAVCVWNARQAEEAVTLHGVARERVEICGAVAYDRWFGWEPSPRAEWAARVGLDPRRPVLLYVGSSAFIAPDEGAFVREWVAAVRARPGLADAQVLVRPHPLNPPSDAELSDLGVAVFPRRGANPTTAEARRDYFDALHHAAAIAGVNTSAFLEGAIAGSPVHTVLVERYRTTQTGTLHFEHLTPAAGGPLLVAATLDEHTAQLADSLNGGAGAARARLSGFVDAFVRPHGRERAAADVLADAIERAAARVPAPRPPAAPGGRALAHAAHLALRAFVATRSPA